MRRLDKPLRAVAAAVSTFNDHSARRSMLRSAIPVLASLNIGESLTFYETELGFSRRHEEEEFGIVYRDDVEIHFWKCSDRRIAEQTSCRIRVEGIGELYKEWEARSFIHPNANLERKWWGDMEFGIIDPFGNLIVFYEPG
jgi:hypothetical protein